MPTAFVLIFGALCASATVSFGEKKRLLDSCYKGRNNYEFDDETFVCSLSPTHRVIGFSSTPGIYRIECHPVFGALYDLLYYWECKTKTTAIIIDNTSGLSQLSAQSLMKRTPATECSFDIINVDDTEIISGYSCYLISKYRYIVIAGRDNTTERILTSGKNCKEKSSGYTTWIIVTTETPIYLNNNDFANYVNPLKSQMIIIIPQNQMTSVDEHKQHLAIKYCKNYSSILHVEKTFINHQLARRIDIHDVFRSNTTNKLESIKFASWSPLRGLTHSYDILNDNQKLHGRIVRLTSTKVYPYTILDENNDVVGGILHDPYNTLGRYFKAQHELLPLKDFNFGIDINGSLTGMYGVMQRGEADISISMSAMREFRLKAAYYGTKIANGCLQMVMPRPSSAVPPTVYILSFDQYVWITIGIGLLVAAIILALTITFTPHNTTLLMTIRSSKQFIYWVLSGQFLEIAFDNPSGWAVKWTYYVILTTTMTVFIYYTSIFTSFLTYRELKLPFETFGELAENDDYQIVVAEASSMRTTLEQSNDEEFKKVWKRIVDGGRKSMMPSFEAGYQKVLTGKYVFIGDGPSTQALAKGSCETIFPKTTYMKESYYMTFRRDFPYTRIYANRFLRQKETGVINRWERIFKPESGSCEENLDCQSLNLYHVFTLFVGLSIGIAASLSILAIEIVVHKKSAKKIIRLNIGCKGSG
ncbi:hypothetical protein CHUAL_003048 [Chamberlinius hualienensis]